MKALSKDARSKSARAGTRPLPLHPGRLLSQQTSANRAQNGKTAQNGKAMHNLTASLPAAHFLVGSNSRLTSRPDGQNSPPTNIQ
jgi:hypothetical protein